VQLLEIARLVMGQLKTSGNAEVEMSFGFISHVALDQKWVDERIGSHEILAWMLKAELDEGVELGAFDVHMRVTGEKTVITFDHESSLQVQAESEEWIEFLKEVVRGLGGEVKRI
jgi:hypothetical protein